MTLKGIEAWKAKVDEAQKMVEEKKIEIKADVERRRKAQWFTSLCNQRVIDVYLSNHRHAWYYKNFYS